MLLLASEEECSPGPACGCGLHRWNVPPGLASVVRLRACCCSLSASMLGSRLLETAGRLEDPLDRPMNVELENYTIYCKCQVLQTDPFYYVYVLKTLHTNNDSWRLTIASFEVDWSCLIGDFCLARLPAVIPGGGT